MASSPSRSATTIVTVRSYHVVKIDGYSSWHFSYRPMGSQHHPENTEFISLYLVLDDIVNKAVVAQASFSLLDHDGSTPVRIYSSTTAMNNFSVSRDRAFGFEDFIKREDLERSEYLKDDCFAIRVRVHIVKEGTDVEFGISGETFAAHRVVLGARSPVFMAELFGPMKEGATTNVIQVDDMEAQVFDALLTFIYTDAWPETEQEDAPAMTQHLLVAADRYRLQGLKLMCEGRLRNHIDTDSVATILALAEQHCCPGLKEACFEFLGSSAALLAPKEIEYIAQSCPTIMNELVSKLAASSQFRKGESSGRNRERRLTK